MDLLAKVVAGIRAAVRSLVGLEEEVSVDLEAVVAEVLAVSVAAAEVLVVVVQAAIGKFMNEELGIKH